MSPELHPTSFPATLTLFQAHQTITLAFYPEIFTSSYLQGLVYAVSTFLEQCHPPSCG